MSNCSMKTVVWNLAYSSRGRDLSTESIVGNLVLDFLSWDHPSSIIIFLSLWSEHNDTSGFEGGDTLKEELSKHKYGLFKGEYSYTI